MSFEKLVPLFVSIDIKLLQTFRGRDGVRGGLGRVLQNMSGLPFVLAPVICRAIPMCCKHTIGKSEEI